MKITCHCGALVVDQTDALPHKGHVIPDQDWHPVFDGIDLIIDDLVAGRSNAETACMKIRSIVGTASRFIYQCTHCGRLFVNDHHHQTREFVPATAATCKQVLRSRDGNE